MKSVFQNYSKTCLWSYVMKSKIKLKKIKQTKSIKRVEGYI